jgi:hypothetical protein
MNWHKVDGKYMLQNKKVREFLLANFGPEFKTKTNTLTKKSTNNHGNWKMDYFGNVSLRYKKDITWFTLYATSLKDAGDRWPFKTGPKI